MTIWAFNDPAPRDARDDKYREHVFKSVEKGFSKFGWSYSDDFDLNLLKEIKNSDREFTEEQKPIWSRVQFLERIKKGDWIVHINIPKKGQCTKVEVTGEYFFDTESTFGEFKHTIPVNPETIVTFPRQDKHIRQNITLANQGAHWIISKQEELKNSLENFQQQKFADQGHKSSGELHLEEDTKTMLEKYSQTIQDNYRGKNLEKFIKEIFLKIPNIEEVKSTGFGWKTDYGVDLIVTVANSALSELNIQGRKDQHILVQVKSYSGTINYPQAIKNIETGYKRYKDDKDYNIIAGLIVTTAIDVTDGFKDKLEEASKELDLEISILYGQDLSRLVLKYL